MDKLAVFKKDLPKGAMFSGTIKAKRKGGLIVALSNGHTALLPINSLRHLNDEELEACVGNKYDDFKISSVKQSDVNNFILVYVRRDALVEEKREKRRREMLEKTKKFQVDQEIKGKIVKYMDYGIFVDLGGVHGLLHRTKFPEDRAKVLNKPKFEEIPVKIIDIKDEKVSLAYRDEVLQ